MIKVYGKGGWIELKVGRDDGKWYKNGKKLGMVVEVEKQEGKMMKE
jgi:hypothetical protein